LTEAENVQQRIILSRKLEVGSEVDEPNLNDSLSNPANNKGDAKFGRLAASSVSKEYSNYLSYLSKYSLSSE